MSRTAKGYI